MGLIDEFGKLTPEKGVLAAEVLTRIGGPGSGRRGLQHACLLLEGAKNNIADDCCKIIALMSVKKVYIYPKNNRFEAIRKHKKFMTFEGDLVSYLNVFDAYKQFTTKHEKGKFCRDYYLHELGLEQAFMIYEKLIKTCKTLKLPLVETIVPDTELLLECIASSFYLNSAYLNHDGYYYTFREKTKLKLHQDCCLFGLDPPPKVITFGDTTEASYQEAVDTQKRVYKTDFDVRLFLVKEVTSFDNMDILYKMNPHYFTF